MKDWIKLCAYTAAALFILLTIAQFFAVHYLPTFIATDLDAVTAADIINMKFESAVEVLDYKIKPHTTILYILDTLQLIAALVVLAVLIYVYNLKNLDESSDIEILEDTDEFHKTAEFNATIDQNTKQVTRLSHDTIDKEISKAYAYDPTDLTDFGNHLCSSLSEILQASQMALYRTKTIDAHTHILELFGAFAYHRPDSKKTTYDFGEGLVGQAAKSQKTLTLTEIPDNYIEIVSGLGQSPPSQLIVIPLIQNDECVGAFEIATFDIIGHKDQQHLLASTTKLIETIALFS
jgi:putative methionine-R-sulfoxide reductase with GAF domain